MAGPFAWLRARRAVRDEQAAARLAEVRAWADGSSQRQLVQVQSVYQHSRRGTKAFVRLDRTQQVRDAWFWWSKIAPGTLVAVAASSGWGPHHGRENVLYIGSERGGPGIYAQLPPKILAAAERHARRQRRP